VRPEAKAPERSRPLRGADLEALVQTAARLVLAGRLSRYYPDPYGAAEYLRALAPSARGGVSDQAVLDLATGLPGLKDLVAIQADRAISADFIRQSADREASGAALSQRLQDKLAYYRRLAAVDLPPLTRLELKLRRVDPERGAAFFEAVFDRYDAAEPGFVRYTLNLEQKDRGWGRAFLKRSGDYPRQTAEFRARIEKVAQDDSELAFLLMGQVEGVRVEEVTRGRIGPLWSPWAPAPAGWLPPGAFALHLPLDQASVNLAADRDNDPFATIYRRFLSSESRSLVEAAAAGLGYRVQKDRKFACSAGAAASLRQRLDSGGTRSLVYEAS
jgi:hypothetical protein